MNWGDVPTWAASAAAIVATFVAIRAKSDGKRSAAAAEQSAADGRRSADAAVRSADTAAEALRLQQEAARPKVVLCIERAANGAHLLKNTGDAAASNLRLHSDDQRYAAWEDPLGNLAGGDVRPFYITAAAAPPARLRFVWDGQAEYVSVAMP